MSIATANTPLLVATVPRAVFSFSTQTYTAVQTAGPNHAVIGNATITAGGAAAQLNGGYASLAANGLVFKAGSARQCISTSKSMLIVVSGRRVGITLAFTMVMIVAPSGSRQAGSKVVGGSTLEWVVGYQTLRPVYSGAVVVCGSGSKTYTYSLANITQTTKVERTTTKPSSTSPISKTVESLTSSKASMTIPSPASTTAEIISSTVVSSVADTATITSMPSSASSLCGAKVAWMAMTSLLVGLSAM